MIPKVIYLCHKELNSLRKSYDHNSLMNPEYKIELYDDTRCKDFLLNEFSKLHCDIFDFLKDGPIKCDFWRLCVLYKYGGVYIDADIELLSPLDSFVEPTVDMCVCVIENTDWKKSPVHHTIKTDKSVYNPHLLISIPSNPIIKKCIDKYINLYTDTVPYGYLEYSIVRIFTQVMTSVNVSTNKENIQIIENKFGQEDIFGDEHGLYKNKRVLNNRTLASNDS